MRILKLMALLLAMVAPVSVLAEGPKRELRGVWLATVWGIDWPSKGAADARGRRLQQQELCRLLDCCEEMNLTTVFFQVRGMADAMYQSSLEPWSAFVSGKRGQSPGWDPLAFAVDECHKRGLECYAWVNPFRWSAGTDYSTSFDRRWKSDGWLLSYDKYTVFNPGLEEARSHVVDVCREIITGYDVDGLVFDDYFYPNRIPETKSAPDYRLWQQQAPWMTFGDWRRANVNKTVDAIHTMIADTRPGVRFGISPAGVAGKSHTSASKWGMEPVGVKADDWQYNEIYSDPLGWLYQGTVDFISPQIYWSTSHKTAPYEPLARWWSDAANLYGCHIYNSMTLASLERRNTPDERRELLSHIDVNRSCGMDGQHGTVLYSAKFIGKLAPSLKKGHFAQKALSPEIKKGTVTSEVPAPGSVRLHKGVLSWKPDTSEGLQRFAVYLMPEGASPDRCEAADGDGIDGRYLYRVVYGNSIAVPTGPYEYAVTRLDPYSVESEPVWAK